MSIYCDGAVGEELRADAITPRTIGTGDFTVAGWVRPNSTNDHRAFTAMGSYDPAIYICMSSAAWGYYNSSPGFQFNTTLSTNTWYHLAVRRVSDIHYGYVNGVQEGNTNDDSYSVPNGRIAVGCENGSTMDGSPMDGFIEDVCWWDVALPVNAIKAMAAGYRAAFFPDNMLAYWPLDVPGDDVYDGDAADGDYGLRSGYGGGAALEETVLANADPPSWARRSTHDPGGFLRSYPGLIQPNLAWASTVAGAAPGGNAMPMAMCHYRRRRTG